MKPVSYDPMECGLAWPIHVSGYNQTNWSISEPEPGEAPHGWLIWEEPSANMGAKTKEDRRKDADAFLGVWNAWANGSVYGYSLEDALGRDVSPACGGYILATREDEKYLAGEIRAGIGAARVVTVKDETGFLADQLGFQAASE